MYAAAAVGSGVRSRSGVRRARTRDEESVVVVVPRTPPGGAALPGRRRQRLALGLVRERLRPVPERPRAPLRGRAPSLGSFAERAGLVLGLHADADGRARLGSLRGRRRAVPREEHRAGAGRAGGDGGGAGPGPPAARPGPGPAGRLAVGVVLRARVVAAEGLRGGHRRHEKRRRAGGAPRHHPRRVQGAAAEGSGSSADAAREDGREESGRGGGGGPRVGGAGRGGGPRHLGVGVGEDVDVAVAHVREAVRAGQGVGPRGGAARGAVADVSPGAAGAGAGVRGARDRDRRGRRGRGRGRRARRGRRERVVPGAGGVRARLLVHPRLELLVVVEAGLLPEVRADRALGPLRAVLGAAHAEELTHRARGKFPPRRSRGATNNPDEI